MEVLIVTGAIASIAQLIEIAGKIGSKLVELIEEIKDVPEELPRQQLTLQSIRAKLQLLNQMKPLFR